MVLILHSTCTYHCQCHCYVTYYTYCMKDMDGVNMNRHCELHTYLDIVVFSESIWQF